MNRRHFTLSPAIFLFCIVLPLACSDDDPGTGASLPPLYYDGTPATALQLQLVSPVSNAWYTDFPLQGETWENQCYSYFQARFIYPFKYAAAKVHLLAGSWSNGNGAPLGLGYGSEVDGDIPGTDVGGAFYPTGTHENGTDFDVAYYQTAADNNFRTVCPCSNAGVPAYHCTEPPDRLDARRTALFIAALAEHTNLRIIGVDGQIGIILTNTLRQLESEGIISLSNRLCTLGKLAFEVSDTGLGWFLYHNTRMYVSFQP